MTRKRSERPTNRKSREYKKPEPRGERITDIGSHQQPSIHQIIDRTVKRLVEQNGERREGLIESFDEFDNWETPDDYPDFTDSPRAEVIEMTEERFRSIPKELLPGKADRETESEEIIPLSSTEAPEGAGDQPAPAG